MVRKSMWAALAVLLAYAPGALAYQYEVSQTATLTYATELFGAGSDSSRIGYCRTVEAGCPSGVPKVTLWTILSDGQGNAGDENDIDANDEMEITLTIRNAVFAFGFRASNIKMRSYATNDRESRDASATAYAVATDADVTAGNLFPNQDNISRGLSVTREDGGAAGDSSVSFMAKATGDWADNDNDTVGTVIEIEIELPELMGLNGEDSVTAQIKVDASGGSGFMESEEASVVETTTAKSTSGGILRRAGAANATTGVRPSVALLTFKDALTFVNAGGGLPAKINLAGGRTSIITNIPGVGPIPYGYLARPAIGVGDSSANTSQWNGETFSIANRESGQGDLVISVTGQFHESGDIVFLDLNGSGRPDSDELLSLRDGVMSGRFSLIEVAGTGESGTSDEVERRSQEGVAARNLFFLPNGVDTLRPAEYRTTMSVDFTHRGNIDKDGQDSIPVPLETSYTVINPQATRQAYAIPPVGGSDVGNVRIKCETAVDCTLYLECDDSEGRDWFQKLADPVPARATMRLTADMIATHLGISEDGWDGRLACSVMSTQTISVQMLTRSGDVLVNNTYIDN